MTEHSTVDDLLVEAGRGSDAAFTQFHDRTEAALFRVALWVVGCRTHAEDAVQDAMVDLWRNAARFNPARGGAMAWTYTVCRRRAVDKVRSVSSTDARDRRASAAAYQPDFDQVLDSVITRSESEQLRLRLRALTPLQREMIELVYYQNHTPTEAATVLGIPVATGKSRLHQAFRHLRAIYADAGGEHARE